MKNNVFKTLLQIRSIPNNFKEEYYEETEYININLIPEQIALF